jgi:hypothetical protein
MYEVRHILMSLDSRTLLKALQLVLIRPGFR